MSYICAQVFTIAGSQIVYVKRIILVYFNMMFSISHHIHAVSVALWVMLLLHLLALFL